jgi:hypothetical protein
MAPEQSSGKGYAFDAICAPRRMVADMQQVAWKMRIHRAWCSVVAAKGPLIW